MFTDIKKLLAILPVLAFSACSPDNRESMQEVASRTNINYELNENDREIVKATNDFGLMLLKQIAKDKGKQDMVFSPMGVVYCMNILANGATSGTLKEINQALGHDRNKIAHINQLNRLFLIGQYKGKDEDKETTRPPMQTCNLLAINGKLTLKSDYEDILSYFYFTQIEKAKDAGDLQRRADKWCSDMTNRQVNHIPIQLTDNSKACFINLIDFNAQWTTPFKAKNTQKRLFFFTEKQAKPIEMMSMVDEEKEMKGMAAQDFSVLRIPYKDKFTMTILLPHEGISLTNIISKLNLQLLDNINNKLKCHDTTYVEIPKFTTKNQINLNSCLAATGIKKAFSNQAEFSNICTTPLRMDRMVQQTEIKVHEGGTEAKAVTTVEFAVLSAFAPRHPSVFHFKACRPFLYYITDAFGNLCFIGTYYSK